MVGRSWFGDSAKKTLATWYNSSRLFSLITKMDELVDYSKDTLPENEIFAKGNTLFNVDS